MMPIDLLADPRRLAGDIAIMRAVAHAGFNQFSAVETERSRRGGDDARLCRQTVERNVILGIGNQQIRPCRIYTLELGSISPGDGPAQATGSELLAIRDRLPAGKSGGSVKNDVIFAVILGISAHTFELIPFLNSQYS